MMQNVEKRVELLAPAGSVEGFYGAIHGGADAVYLAGNRFGARAYAENFTTEALLECIRYGHLMGRKLYLTVNTLLKECELHQLYSYLLPFYEAGLDAVIVQDLGVFRFIREYFPDCKLHVSTQMTICGSFGSALLKEMGASRIVPARELSLKEIVEIKKRTGVELETFIHGAMCYCYSGQCLFSSILGGRSGNRGRCAQPCRLSYDVTTKKGNGCEKGYPLSLKDLCTITHIPKLIEAGIDSFKIEGRMKKPEYAAGVTRVYRRYIDRYLRLRQTMGVEEAQKAFFVEEEDKLILNSLYIRSEVQDGYYFRHNGREMITMKTPSYSGSDEALLADIRRKYIDDILRLPIKIRAFFLLGQPAEIQLQWEDVCVKATGQLVEQAQKQPITEENVRKQLGKLGESAFYGFEIEVGMDDNVFYPLKQINELRRQAVAKLEEQILCARGYTQGNKSAVSSLEEMRQMMLQQEPASEKKVWALSVCTGMQLEAVSEWLSLNQDEVACRGMRIYIDGDMLVNGGERVDILCHKLSELYKIYAVLPYIVREAQYRYLESLYEKAAGSGDIHGFLVRSMDGMGFISQKGGKLPCRTDAGVYVWNGLAGQEIGVRAEGICLRYELKASEQRKLLQSLKLPCEKIVYSRIPMMISANCLYKTTRQCRRNTKTSEGKGLGKRGNKQLNFPKEEAWAFLKDKRHVKFPVKVNCLHCINVIYNSVPFSLYSELGKWREAVDLRMDFTLESPEEVKQLLDSFLRGAPLPQGKYIATTGHEKRGVE